MEEPLTGSTGGCQCQPTNHSSGVHSSTSSKGTCTAIEVHVCIQSTSTDFVPSLQPGAHTCSHVFNAMVTCPTLGTWLVQASKLIKLHKIKALKSFSAKSSLVSNLSLYRKLSYSKYAVDLNVSVLMQYCIAETFKGENIHKFVL